MSPMLPQQLCCEHSHETPGSVTDGDKSNSTPIHNYLIHYKWTWHFPVPLSFSKVSLALLRWSWIMFDHSHPLMLFCYRERLNEGFHITSTHNGYVSMCVELSMKVRIMIGSCIVLWNVCSKYTHMQKYMYIYPI